MYLSLIFLPLQGGQQSNRFNGIKLGPILSILSMFITQILTLISFYEVVMTGSPVTINQGHWIKYEQIQLDWSFTFDTLTISMFLPVITISFLAQQYSYSYMNGDPHILRFFFYLSFFTFTMILLITGDNQLIQFLGWEGVGVASYQLINFWFTKMSANLASMKAFQINRLGDYGLMLGIILVLAITSDQSFAVLLPLSHLINSDLQFLAIILLMIGAMAKSAQFGLHTWLAESMEAPTPVSALIHAATMVTAGVYLFMKISPMLEWSSLNQVVITWLGGITALQAAACGQLENDLKKQIAFSTSSQLGYMVVACGISQYSLALFHLINHAFFKALLFQSAGAVLHALLDEQDMRKMGNLVHFLPITYSCFIIGSLSLMAFPFFTGFYSKDFIQEILFIPNNTTQTIAYLLTLVAAFLTSIYSIRLLIITFQSKPNFNNRFGPPHRGVVTNMIHDPLDFPILFTFILLALGSIFFGYLTQELFIGGGTEIYMNSIFTHPSRIRLFDSSLSEFTILKLIVSQPLVLLITLLPLRKKQIGTPRPGGRTTCGSGGTLKNLDLRQGVVPLKYQGKLLTQFKRGQSHAGSDNLKPVNVVPLYWITKTFSHFNIFNYWIMHSSLNNSISLYRYFDKGLLQYFGPFGIFRKLNFNSFNIEILYTGFIIHYVLLTIFGLFLFQNISYILLQMIIILIL